jgi:hypothetical protein
MQISDLSGEQQQQLAMQEGATTPEGMIMVLKTLAEDPENLARALSMMGLDVSPEEVQQAAAWMDQSAGASAGMPAESEQSEGEASAAADVDDSGAPPDTASAAPIEDEAAEAAPDVEPVAEGEAPMPPRGGPQQPSMDDVVSASVMQGAPGPAPQMRGTPNFSKMKGPAGLKQPRAGAPSQGQDAALMKLLQAKRAR